MAADHRPLILLTGASGYIGGRLLKELEKAGWPVRCLARRPDFLRPKVVASTEVVKADCLNRNSLASAMAGVDTAYYLVHSMGSPGKFEQEDREAAQNFADVARDSGVRRIIYLGGLGKQSQALSAHLRSRHEVADILRSSGIPTLEFRASIVIGSGSLSFEMIRALVQRLPVMICPRWVAGQLTDSSNKVLVNPGLWDMVFGGGGPSGDPNTLYLTAGGSNQPNFPSGGNTTAVFASLVPAAAVTNANFSLNVSAQSATVAPGGSANLMVSASAVGGFNSQITLSCTAPAGLSCTFSPTTISPGSSATSSTLTIAATSTPPPVTGYSLSGVASLLLPGLGVFGTVLTTRKRKPLASKSVLWTSALGLLLVISMFSLGCGSSSNSPKAQTSASQVTLMVTGTSGALSHTTPVTVTIN